MTVLRTLNDELNVAVAEAYGWPANLPDEEILRRLVALNRERLREKRDGLVRWLRPEIQAPQEALQDSLVQVAADESFEEAVATIREPSLNAPAPSVSVSSAKPILSPPKKSLSDSAVRLASPLTPC